MIMKNFQFSNQSNNILLTIHVMLCTRCSCDQDNFTKMSNSLHSQFITHYNTHKFQHLNLHHSQCQSMLI